MSDENLNGNNEDNDNIQDPAHQMRLPLQPDIGLGSERSNNESRRNHHIEPSPGSVSFSHFLGRPPGASNAGLPDFVQDHLADIPYNLNQSRSSCDNANPTLPDFLSDAQRSVHPPDPSSSLSSSNNLLQLENDNLRREMENLRRLLAQQHALIVRLEREQADQVLAASSSSASSSHSQSLAALQQEVESLRAENRALKARGASEATSASHGSTGVLSRELRQQATRSEQLVRGLMGAVASMKDLADQIAQSSPDNAEVRDYREVPSDSEDD